MIAFGQLQLFFRILLLIIFTPLVMLHQWKARILNLDFKSILSIKRREYELSQEFQLQFSIFAFGAFDHFLFLLIANRPNNHAVWL